MKTLVIYASKYGTAKKCAELINKKIEGSEIIEISNVNNINIKDFDTIVFGSSIYAGSINKNLLEFIKNNLDTLSQKKLGIYTCGLQPYENGIKQLESFYPPEILPQVKFKEYFGGEVDYSKMNFFERFIIRLITKSKTNISNILVDKIDLFSSQILS